MRRDAKAGAVPSFADVFVMSKGHGCVSQYVILEEFGILTRKDLDTYCTPDGPARRPSRLRQRPASKRRRARSDMALGIAVGMAYAEKVKGTDRRVHVVLSDGEVQEGSTWEAIMMAANLGLNNLIGFHRLQRLLRPRAHERGA